MRGIEVLFIGSCLLASVHGFPGGRDGDSDEKNVDTVLVLPSDTRERFMRPWGAINFPDASLEDSDSMENPVWTWNRLFRTNVLDGWYSSMQAQMRRLREQMAVFLSNIAEQGSGTLWSKIPEGANTTSTTKIVDGHVVTINETTYMDGDDEFGTVIRVRVIDVKPQNETIPSTESDSDGQGTTIQPMTTGNTPADSKEESTTIPTRSVETVEDFNNEIPKNQVDTLTA